MGGAGEGAVGFEPPQAEQRRPSRIRDRTVNRLSTDAEWTSVPLHVAGRVESATKVFAFQMRGDRFSHGLPVFGAATLVDGVRPHNRAVFVHELHGCIRLVV